MRLEGMKGRSGPGTYGKTSLKTTQQPSSFGARPPAGTVWLLWDSFWNKRSDTNESGREEMSHVTVGGSQSSSRKALISGAVCILSSYSKPQGWARLGERASSGQVVKGNDPLF